MTKIEKYSDAFTTIEKAINIKPGYPQAWTTKGDILIDLGKLNGAIKAYDMTIKIIPDDDAYEIPRLGKIKYQALNKKGLVFVRNQQFKEAAAEFEQALNPSSTSKSRISNNCK